MPKVPKVKKVDEIALLSEKMLADLDSRRQEGGDAYPPTLRQLAESCGVPPEDEGVLKAVAKAVFTRKANARATGKVGLDLPVYFKEDVPDKETLLRIEVADLAGRMLGVLESQRPLGGDHYPPTLRQLAELCGRKGSDKPVPKAAIHETMDGAAILANGVKPALDAPVVLRRDLESDEVDLVPALLRFAFDKSRGKTPPAFSPKQLSTKLHKAIQPRFVKDLGARIDRRELPSDYAWVQTGENALLFMVSDIQPGITMPKSAEESPEVPTIHWMEPTREFAPAFREAFERIDRHHGMTNFVKLVNLRRELADFDRERFDAGLRQLRIEKEFSLNSHEGLVRPLTPEEREAGIIEVGSLLVYASRR